MEEPDTGGLDDLFEDLEQQAAGMQLAERDAELADRARGEYAAVTLASRVHASVGHDVALTLAGGGLVEGLVTEAGVDWCAVVSRSQGDVWLVRLEAIVLARGMSSRAVPEAARPVVARLRFGSALHRMAAGAGAVHVHVDALPARKYRVLRVGADFVEVEQVDGQAGPVLVPISAISAVRVG